VMFLARYSRTGKTTGEIQKIYRQARPILDEVGIDNAIKIIDIYANFAKNTDSPLAFIVLSNIVSKYYIEKIESGFLSVDKLTNIMGEISGGTAANIKGFGRNLMMNEQILGYLIEFYNLDKALPELKNTIPKNFKDMIKKIFSLLAREIARNAVKDFNASIANIKDISIEKLNEALFTVRDKYKEMPLESRQEVYRSLAKSYLGQRKDLESLIDIGKVLRGDIENLIVAMIWMHGEEVKSRDNRVFSLSVDVVPNVTKNKILLRGRLIDDREHVSRVVLNVNNLNDVIIWLQSVKFTSPVGEESRTEDLTRVEIGPNLLDKIIRYMPKSTTFNFRIINEHTRNQTTNISNTLKKQGIFTLEQMQEAFKGTDLGKVFKRVNMNYIFRVAGADDYTVSSNGIGVFASMIPVNGAIFAEARISPYTESDFINDYAKISATSKNPARALVKVLDSYYAWNYKKLNKKDEEKVSKHLNTIIGDLEISKETFESFVDAYKSSILSENIKEKIEYVIIELITNISRLSGVIVGEEDREKRNELVMDLLEKMQLIHNTFKGVRAFEETILAMFSESILNTITEQITNISRLSGVIVGEVDKEKRNELVVDLLEEVQLMYNILKGIPVFKKIVKALDEVSNELNKAEIDFVQLKTNFTNLANELTVITKSISFIQPKAAMSFWNRIGMVFASIAGWIATNYVKAIIGSIAPVIALLSGFFVFAAIFYVTEALGVLLSSVISREIPLKNQPGDLDKVKASMSVKQQKKLNDLGVVIKSSDNPEKLDLGNFKKANKEEKLDLGNFKKANKEIVVNAPRLLRLLDSRYWRWLAKVAIAHEIRHAKHPMLSRVPILGEILVSIADIWTLVTLPIGSMINRARARKIATDIKISSSLSYISRELEDIEQKILERPWEIADSKIEDIGEIKRRSTAIIDILNAFTNIQSELDTISLRIKNNPVHLTKVLNLSNKKARNLYELLAQMDEKYLTDSAKTSLKPFMDKFNRVLEDALTIPTLRHMDQFSNGVYGEARQQLLALLKKDKKYLNMFYDMTDHSELLNIDLDYKEQIKSMEEFINENIPKVNPAQSLESTIEIVSSMFILLTSIMGNMNTVLLMSFIRDPLIERLETNIEILFPYSKEENVMQSINVLKEAIEYFKNMDSQELAIDRDMLPEFRKLFELSKPKAFDLGDMILSLKPSQQEAIIALMDVKLAIKMATNPLKLIRGIESLSTKT
ncbi:hypothetical protein ACFL58_04795, partial [Elusimicrobiota bacterium]